MRSILSVRLGSSSFLRSKARRVNAHVPATSGCFWIKWASAASVARRCGQNQQANESEQVEPKRVPEGL